MTNPNAFRAALKSSASFGWGIGVLLALPLLASPAFANPLSSVVTTGSAAVASSTNKTTIDQKSEDVVIDWSSFNIGAGQTTQFVQPNAQAIAVNRIGGNSASQILGTLDANGRIVLINGNGMLFGNGAAVNVGSLIATSTGGADSDVLSGKFTQAGNQNAAIVNNGRITASQGGLVALVAPNVSNAGTINAKFGTVAVGAANKFTVDFTGDGLVSFAAQGDVNSKATAINSGSLSGANVSLTAHAAEGVATGVVTMSGIVTAQTAKNVGGVILLDAGDGSLSLTGTLNAAGQTGGGNIETSGNQVSIAGSVSAGRNGSWKVDPENLTIDSTAATSIDNALNSGTSVTEQTTSGAASGYGNQSPGAGDIIVASALSWGTTATLTLDAYHGIGIDARIKATNGGGLDLITNDGGTGGRLAFAPGASVVFSDLTSALAIDGASYTLVDNIAALAGDIAANPGGDYALANSYNAFSDGVYTSSPIATPFTGAFNGLGNVIETLRINDPVAGDAVGLFATLDGSVANLTLSGVKVVGGARASVGALAGVNSGSIVGVTASGAVIGGQNADAGGLVGDGNGMIAASSSSGTVTGGLGATLGGFIGENGADGVVSNSFSSASVTGGANAGGLAGLNAGSIDDSYATGAVSGGNLVGGLVGNNIGAIDASFAMGAVGGGGDVGGLVGLNGSGGVIANTFAMGDVQGGEDVGGLVGQNDWQITASYATGAVSGVARSYVGGVVGADLTLGGIANTYWDTVTSNFGTLADGAGNLANDPGIAGETTTQLQASLPSGFLSSQWGTLAKLTFPYFRWQSPSGTPQVISGTFTGPAGSAIDVLVNGAQIAPLVSLQTGPTDYYYLLLAPGSLPKGSDVLVYDADMTGARLVTVTSASLGGFNFAPGTLLQFTSAKLYSAMAGDLETAIGSNAAVQAFIDAIPDYDITSSASSFTIDQPLDIFTRTSIADSAGYLTVSAAQDWTSASVLTLQGGHAVAIDAPVAVNGAGGLNIVGQLGFNGGDITFADLADTFTINGKPYTLVDTIAQMAAAAQSGDNIALANNYDASADGTYATSPIASILNLGVQGLGNTISNLSINDSSGDNVGLFGNVKHGVIENLNLTNETITAVGKSTSGTGGLVGLNDGVTLLYDSVSGSVSATNGYVGGMVGINEGTVEYSSSTGTVTGAYAGGLVGENGTNIHGKIEYAYSSAAVTGSSMAGGLAADSNSGSSIDGSDATGAVTQNGATGFGYFGGLVGEGYDVSNSYATGTVTSTNAAYAGGLVGTGEYISNSYATGNVSAGNNSYVGGLVGSGGEITDSYATGTVTGGTTATAGGLAGFADGISQSYATGAVTIGSGANGVEGEVGGLVGGNYGSIQNSYATGSATGGTSVNAGGLVGYNDGTIADSYSTVAVSAGSGSSIGGLIGYDKAPSGSLTNSYWDTATSGVTSLSQGAGNVSNDPGITGLTTTQLQSGLPAGFSAAIWVENPSINGGLPYLLALPPS